MYNLLFFLLILSGNIMAQTPCTEYPSPTIVPDFIAHCEDPKPHDQPLPINDPQTHRKEECFVACANSVITYSTFNDPNNTYVWEVFGDANWMNSGSNSQPVTWNSPGAGLVQVTETTPDGCSTTVSICVTIVASPLADFTSIPQDVNGEITICTGGEVFFTDASSDDVITWAWDFGDGAFSNDPSPSHIYNTAGVYTVTLTVYNDCGCTSMKEVKVIVKPQTAPTIACISTLCAGTQGTYSVTACDGATVFWTVDGGTPQDPNANPVVVDWDTNNTTGQGTLTVEVSGCGNDCPVPTTVVVPILTPYLDLLGPTLVCVGDIVEYAIPPQPSTTYDWYLSGPVGPNLNHFIFSAGDQDHSAEIEWNVAGGPYELCVLPQHTLGDFKDECEGYDRICIYIEVRDPFEISGPDEICEGDNAQFVVVGGGVQADWQAIPQGGTPINLATGSSSSGNLNGLPAGIYQIVANSVNPATCNPEAYGFINVKPTAPMVSVTGNLNVCPGSTHNYVASPDPGYFVTWSTADGTVLGSGNEVAITWNNTSGPYTLTVTQENMIPPSCPSTTTITVNELIPNTPVIQTTPIPNITEVCTDGTMAFSVPVDNDVTYYEWEIIPANIGSVVSGQNTENINVQFNNTPNPGTTIQLTYVVCGVTQPAVSYSIDVIAAPNITLNIPAEACQNASPGTQLIADLQPGITGSVAWEWFVDGTSIATTSGSLNSTINYSFPTYGTQLITVEATITGGSCPGVFTATQLINIKPAPVVNITSLASPTHCDNGIFDMVTLFASVQNAAGDPNGNYSYTWSPGGSTNTQIDVFNPGTYTLTVLDNDTGCETSASINIGGCTLVPPCTGVDFTATRNCNSFNFVGSLGNGYVLNPQWSFGDGSGPAFGSTASHTYDHSGYYTVTLTAQNSNGDLCSQSYSVEVLFVPNFIAEFSCPSNQILTDLINQTDHLGFVEPFLSYQWVDATNAVISNLENPSGINLIGFVQPITLNVTYNNGLIFTCSVTETVNVPSPVVASFTAADNVCEGTPVLFTNTSTGGSIISATWDFDDGSGSNLIPSAQRTYVYSASGYYPSLTVEDEYGCVSSITAINPLVIHENSLAGNVTVTGPAGPDCPTVNLTANPSGQNYDWYQVNNGGGDIPFGNGQTSNNIGTTGEYYVIVSDNLGCSAQSDNEEVIVIPPPTAFILGELTYCHDETVSLSANQGSDYDYLWTVSPSVSINNMDPEISFTGSATSGTTIYTVTVVVTNTATQCSSTATIQVEVHPNPSIVIQPVSPACAPTSLTANASSDITSISWSTGSNTLTTDVLGGGTVEVTGFTEAGCSASDTYVLGDGPDVADVAVGCYCYPEPTVWTAPAGYNYSYQWIEQGVGQVGNQQTYLIDHSGIYNVIVTDNNGCTSISDDIIVDIGEDCEKCQFRVYNFEWECVGIDENTGGIIYSYTAQATNFYTSLSGLSGTSNEGIVGPITPSSLPGNFTVTPISGTFILLPGNSSAIITFEAAGANGVNCDYKVEITNFPDCGEPEPCDVDWKKPKVECLYSYGDWSYYTFSVPVINNGGPISDLVMYPCHSPYAIITSSTSSLSTGSSVINGIIQVNTDIVPNECVYVCWYDEVSKKVCCTYILLDFPDCKKQEPCGGLEVQYKKLWCIAPNVDEQNNLVYYFDIQFTGPFANGTAYLLPSTGQAENHVSDLSVTSFGNYYAMTGTIFDVWSYDDPLCFTIRLVREDGKVCTTKLCIKVPTCLSESSPERRLVEDNDEDMLSDDEVTLSVAPNPASTMVMIDYKTKFEGNTSLKLTALNGQVVRHYSNLFVERSIPVDISTLEDGMYFLTIYEDGILKAQEKVVVLGD